MNRVAAAAALAFLTTLAACSNGSTASPCDNSACPAGCDLTPSADDSTCLCVFDPDAGPNVSAGQTCAQDNDCCTGSCDIPAADGGYVCSTVDAGLAELGNSTTTSSGSGGSTGHSTTTTTTTTGGTTSSNCPIPAPEGQSCNADSDCANANFYCNGTGSIKKCQALCTVYACVCPQGDSCDTSNGRCTLPGGTTGGTTASASSTTSAATSATSTGGTGTSSSTTSGSTTTTTTSSSSTTTTTTTTTTTGGSTTGGTTSGGRTSGGSTTGSVQTTGGLDGCTADDYLTNEFASCTRNSSCSCDMSCTSDPNFTGTYCETACQESSDCPDSGDSCQSETCTLNSCTSVYTSCDATGTGDGTCLPFDDGSGDEVDLCIAPGTEQFGQSCSADVTRGAPQLGCANGMICLEFVANDGGTGQCDQGCDPTARNSGCGSGGICQAADNEVATIGYCSDGGF